MTRVLRFAAIAAIASMLPALGLPRAGGAAGGGGTAVFSIVAAQTAANAEMNYNGAAKGGLAITVPVGAAVQLTLSNNGTLPHSMEVIPFTTTLPAAATSTPAFPGAVMKNAQVGITKGQSATVQFTANKAGKYLLICGFPGHALLGMYGTFEVSPSAAAQPTMVVKK
jgi:sulfocyanin